MSVHNPRTSANTTSLLSNLNHNHNKTTVNGNDHTLGGNSSNNNSTRRKFELKFVRTLIQHAASNKDDGSKLRGAGDGTAAEAREARSSLLEGNEKKTEIVRTNNGGHTGVVMNGGSDVQKMLLKSSTSSNLIHNNKLGFIIILNTQIIIS